jgi:hypothetical protein
VRAEDDDMVEKEHLLEELMLLQSKLQYLLDLYIECPEGCFTFPDGDTWWQTGKEPSR